MKRIILLYLILIFIFSFSITACNVEQDNSEASGQIGDMDSPMFSLNGVIYTLPLPLMELVDLGWRIDNDFDASILEPGDSIRVVLTAEGQNIAVKVYNTSDQAQPMSESYVIRVGTHAVYANSKIIFPGDITLGSTYEEVLAAYGKPHIMEDNENAQWHTYYLDGHDVRIAIDNDTNLVTVMDMIYWAID